MDDSAPSKNDAREQGLAALWESARIPVFAQLLAGIGSYHDAEDVLQEVAIAVSREFASYDPERSFVAWALGIARNKMLMHFRKKRRDRLVFDEDMLDLVASRIEAAASSAGDGRKEAIAKCVEKLDAKRREILRLRYGTQLTLEDIAERTGRSVAAMKGLLFRIRRTLAQCVQERLAVGDD